MYIVSIILVRINTLSIRYLFAPTGKYFAFFSDNELLLEVYNNEDFEKMMEKDIVRYSDDPTDFDYIWPEAFIPNSIISNIVPLRGCGTISNLEGIDFHFFNGTKLCIRFSDLVIGTMSSWIEE